jgi:hypothetical protein
MARFAPLACTISPQWEYSWLTFPTEGSGTMNQAKDGARLRTRWLVLCAAFCACSLETGCSTLSGLRSIGPGPSFLAMWNRTGPGSPTPENDSYAQAMNAARPGAAMDAKAAIKPAKSRDVGDGTDPSLGEESGPKVEAPGTAARTRPVRRGGDDPLQVTLGRPEQLPGLALEESRQKLAAANASVPWNADSTNEKLGDAPALAGPGERKDALAPAPPLLANDAKPAPKADSAALLARAEAKLDGLKSYQVKMSRRERVGGQLQPEEKILLSIRREPRAVRLEWTEGFNKGREVIYSSRLDPGVIFVHQPAAAVVLPSMKIPVDSPLIMKNSRHSIAEAGFDSLLENVRHSRKSADQNQSDPGNLVYKGLETPAGVDRPCHHFARHSQRGETWNVYLDPKSMLPRLVVAEDDHGQLLERYDYQAVRENPTELASAGAFEPDERWGKSNGLFSRLARAAAGSNQPSDDDSTKR